MMATHKHQPSLFFYQMNLDKRVGALVREQKNAKPSSEFAVCTDKPAYGHR